MSLSSVANTVASISGIIVVSPQKTIGIQAQKFPTTVKDYTTPDDAFLFDIEGEQKLDVSSDITDHFIESNESVADQIALKPEMYMISGFIGELTDVLPKDLQPLKLAANKLVAIGPYMPQLSVTALTEYNKALYAASVAAGAASSLAQTLESISGSGGQSVLNGTNGLSKQKNQSKQQAAYQKLYSYWRARTLFTVQTPWLVMQDMAIQNMTAVQDAETRMITEIQITFKLMRFATTKLIVGISSDNAQGRTSSQSAAPVDLGTQTLSPSAIPFAPAG